MIGKSEEADATSGLLGRCRHYALDTSAAAAAAAVVAVAAAARPCLGVW